MELAAERPSLSFTTVTITEFADSGMEPSLRVFDSYGEVHFTISSSSFIPCSISTFQLRQFSKAAQRAAFPQPGPTGWVNGQPIHQP